MNGLLANGKDATIAAGVALSLPSVANGGALTLSGPTKTLGSVTAASLQASGGNTAVNGVQNITGSATYDATTLNAPVNAANLNLASVTFDVPGVAATVSGSVQTGPVALQQNTELRVGGSYSFGGVQANGFTFTINQLITTEVSQDTDRRILSTILPQMKKGQAGRAGLSATQTKDLPVINKCSADVPLPAEASGDWLLRFMRFLAFGTVD